MGALSTSDGDKLAPADMFGLLTCISAAVSVPAALLVEGRALPALWASAAAGYPAGSLGLAGQVAATGLYFYGYSEVAMKALNNVHPVTHAIGNTMRRVLPAREACGSPCGSPSPEPPRRLRVGAWSSCSSAWSPSARR